MSYVFELRKMVGNRPLLAPGGRAVVVNSAGDVLFHHRVDLNIWDLPGGSADVGESQSDSVIRELKEETGLTPIDWTPIGLASDPERETVHYPNGDIVQGFSLVLLVEKWQGTLRTSSESNELRWFPIGEPPKQLRANITETLAAYERWHQTAQFQLF